MKANFFLVHELYPSVPPSGSALIYIPDIPTPPNGTDSVRICLQVKKKGEGLSARLLRRVQKSCGRNEPGHGSGMSLIGDKFVRKKIVAVHKRIDLIVGTFGSNSNPINRSLNPYSNAACIGRDPSTHKRRTLARDDLGSAPSITRGKASCSFMMRCAPTQKRSSIAL